MTLNIKRFFRFADDLRTLPLKSATIGWRAQTFRGLAKCVVELTTISKCFVSVFNRMRHGYTGTRGFSL